MVALINSVPWQQQIQRLPGYDCNTHDCNSFVIVCEQTYLNS